MIKKGLKVKILAGKDKDKEGEVIEIDRSNKKAKVKPFSSAIPFSLHIWIIWAISPLRCFPSDIFTWVLNITCFAMNAIL